MKRPGRFLWRDCEGAVAPTVALSLFALIAAGGIAFDYAHMASLHTELQDAADQAALAAATQLDGTAGARTRATAAAQSLLANKAVFADVGGTAVTVSSVIFYQTAANAEANSNPVTSDKTAHFARIILASKRANFALTPVVGAIASGNIAAEAVAGLKSSLCKIPPLMLCNPAEAGGSTAFNVGDYIGDGIKMVAVGNGGGPWQAGDFGYLQNNGGANGAPGLRQLLGWDTPPGDCLQVDTADTKPGATTTVTDALNTRFDITENGTSCPSGGTCTAAQNAVKDLVDTGSCSWGLDAKGGPSKIGYYGNKYPNASAPGDLPTTITPSSMGFPEDECHYTSCPNGRVGDGHWDRDAYFRTNYARSGSPAYWTGGTAAHSWQANTGLPANATRYQVYSWELAHRGQTIDGVTILAPRAVGTSTAYGEGGHCRPVQATTAPDRRRITAAVVNCGANNVKGNTIDVPVETWIDIFLVEPSWKRTTTSRGDIYVEVIAATTGATTTSAGTGQLTRRDVPFLVK